MDDHELTPGELANRSGVAISALHFYEREGLISSRRTSGNQRRYARDTLRRVAFIRMSQRLGIPLARVRSALGTLPTDRVPTSKDWAKLSAGWRQDLDDRILASAAPARQSRRLHRLRLPEPAQLCAVQPRRCPRRAGAGASSPLTASNTRAIEYRYDVRGAVRAVRAGRPSPAGRRRVARRVLGLAG